MGRFGAEGDVSVHVLSIRVYRKSNLVKIIQATEPARSAPGAKNSRQRRPNKQADDTNHYQHFDQCDPSIPLARIRHGHVSPAKDGRSIGTL